MSEKIPMQEFQCPCGTTKFTLRKKPLVRLFCHCTICQEFNDAPYADVSIFLSKHVQLHDQESVKFKTYKAPPAVQRGKCISCDKPIIEFFDMPLIPAMTIIPSANITKGQYLVEPSTHIFYHRRIADVNDELSKHSGFLKSQLVVSTKVISGLFTR